MSDVIVTVVGNVATDVKHVVTPQGTPVTTFRLAATPRRVDRGTGRWVDGVTSFYTVNCWRGLADNTMSSLVKGQPVIVVGRQRVRQWERDGRSGTSVELDAVTVGHDLLRGTASFRKVRRERAGERDDRDAVEELHAEFEADTGDGFAAAGPGDRDGHADAAGGTSTAGGGSGREGASTAGAAAAA
jgi:single-strand DNA-binding protein